MKVIFVRHGETNWNKIGRQQGKINIILNETGLRQAKQAAEQLKDVHFDHVYCSPLMRARQTAQAICKGRTVPVTYDERISERDMGEFQGKHWEEFGIIQRTLTISRRKISAIFMPEFTPFWTN